MTLQRKSLVGNKTALILPSFRSYPALILFRGCCPSLHWSEALLDSESLTRSVVGAAMRVHNALGPGFLESVYQNALTVELRAAGLAVECERRLRVEYRGVVVGEFAADMVVDGRLLIENKAVRAIVTAHEAQLLNYLAATGTAAGLLLNFGAPRLEFRRRTREYGGRTAQPV